MNNLFIAEFQKEHLNIWNEKDRTKRDVLLSKVYSDNIKMYDKDFILTGHVEISDFIDKVQGDPKFYFSAEQPMDFTQNTARLFWEIATAQGIIHGMDFFVFENGKVQDLYVYMKLEA